MFFRLDFQSETPIYKQLRDQVVLAIANEKLLPGEQLPTTRALAEDAGVNIMTVSKAYQLLKSEGYIVTDRRNGAVISASPVSSSLSAQQLSQLRLLAGEAKIAGLSQEAFLAQCKAVFSELEG